eukprot:3194680-Amphidinium_carterae.4
MCVQQRRAYCANEHCPCLIIVHAFMSGTLTIFRTYHADPRARDDALSMYHTWQQQEAAQKRSSFQKGHDASAATKTRSTKTKSTKYSSQKESSSDGHPPQLELENGEEETTAAAIEDAWEGASPSYELIKRKQHSKRDLKRQSHKGPSSKDLRDLTAQMSSHKGPCKRDLKSQISSHLLCHLLSSHLLGPNMRDL